MVGAGAGGEGRGDGTVRGREVRGRAGRAGQGCISVYVDVRHSVHQSLSRPHSEMQLMRNNYSKALKTKEWVA